MRGYERERGRKDLPLEPVLVAFSPDQAATKQIHDGGAECRRFDVVISVRKDVVGGDMIRDDDLGKK
jgi:hypothetical protein